MNGSPIQGVFSPTDTQDFGEDPTAVRESDHYRGEYVRGFVDKWDELIDWEARAKSEGRFFIDVLKARGKETVLDVATGTGFHSIQLLKAGFDVTSADGSAEMLARAFDNARDQGLVLKTVHADWRWLNKDVNGKYDAIICLGNSFTHLFEENDRRRALAEFYAALKHDGILIIDQRNYDRHPRRRLRHQAQILLLRRPGHGRAGACRRQPGAVQIFLPRRIGISPEHVPAEEELSARAVCAMSASSRSTPMATSRRKARKPIPISLFMLRRRPMPASP